VSQGLRANWAQFALLVVINGFVGGMVGLERAVLPLLAEAELGVAAPAAMLSFLVVFGLSKAGANYWAGRAMERWGRRPVLLAGWLLAAPVPLALLWAPSWGWVVAVNALLGLSQGLTWSTAVVMKVDLAGPRQRGLAVGLNESAGYLAVALAALASGFLAAQLGLRAAFGLGVVFVLAGGGLSLLWARETQDLAATESSAVPSQLSAGQVFQRTTLGDPDLSSACQVGFVNNLNDGLAWGLFPLLFAASGLTLEQIGVVAAITPAVWGLGQLGAGALSDRVGRKPLIVVGMSLQALALAGVALAGSMAAYAGASALLGLGTALVYPTLLAVIGDGAHPSWRASAIGVYRLWRDSGYAAGALLAGALAATLGVRAAVWGVAALTLVSAASAALRMTGLKAGATRTLRTARSP
jgi:MFS family permease